MKKILRKRISSWSLLSAAAAIGLLTAGLLALAKPQQDGRLTLTVEVIYGHALKPIPRLKVQSESTVSLQDMRTLLSKK